MSRIDLLSEAINANDIRADYCILDMLIPNMVSVMIGDWLITHEGTVFILKQSDVTIIIGCNGLLFDVIVSDGELNVLNCNVDGPAARICVEGYGSFNYVVVKHDTTATAQKVVEIYNAFMRPIIAAMGVCMLIKVPCDDLD